MAQVIEGSRADHVNFAGLLDLFDRQIAFFMKGNSPISTFC